MKPNEIRLVRGLIEEVEDLQRENTLLKAQMRIVNIFEAAIMGRDGGCYAVRHSYAQEAMIYLSELEASKAEPAVNPIES